MNNHKLLQRVLTASILAFLVLLGIFWLPIFAFTQVVILILLISAWEWSRIIGLKKISFQIVFISSVFFLFLICLKFAAIKILYLALGWWLCCLGLVLYFPTSQVLWASHKIIPTIMGFLILIPFGISLIVLRQQGSGYLLLGLFLVWAADTGAFLVGRKWGKNKLIPKVSPNKTLEGFWGGVFFTIIIAIIGFFLLHIPYKRWGILLLLVILTNIAAVVGDLFESMMKRFANVKDSGNWLPGHGGILDRIDSLTCAMPVFAIGILSFLF